MHLLAHCGTNKGHLRLASDEQSFINSFDVRVGLNEMKPNITGGKSTELVLPEHLHAIGHLPRGDADYPLR
jgi:hypothetical protein